MVLRGSTAVGASPTTPPTGRWTSCSPPSAIASEIFASVAHLLNLDLDIVFVDTTSTYWEVDVADDLADLQPEPEVDDGTCKPAEYGLAGSASPPITATTGPRW
jgi:hypothetical protein